MEPRDDEERGPLALAQPYLRIITLSIKATGSRFWNSPISKGPQQMKIGDSLDLIFKDDLWVNILHEVLHIIDPSIGDSELYLVDLPAHVLEL